jgi:hypothetical protein
MKNQLIALTAILSLNLAGLSQSLLDIPSFALGYGTSSYKSPVIYARKDYFNSVVELQKDALNAKSLDKCIDKIGGNNEALINELRAQIEYLKKQNEVLLNKCLN